MDIRVPQIAEGVTGGTVVSIQVKAGDLVKKDQVLLELETNKAVAGIHAPSAGKVSQVLVKEGQQVVVGQVLLSLAGSDAADAPPVQIPSAPDPEKVQLPRTPQFFKKAPVLQPAASFGSYQYESLAGIAPPASPSVRKAARELGIDLTRVQGTESGGRISMEDLRAYIVNLQAIHAADPHAAMKAAAADKKPAAPSIDFSKWGPVTKKALTPIRLAISDAMVRSWTTIPHVTQFDDLDITKAMALRKQFAADYEKKGAKLTLTPLVIRAIIQALKKHPIFNSSLDENSKEIVTKDYFHIGIAVDSEHGLMVPVIRDADKKSLLEISLELEKLAEKVRTRKITAEEMQGGTFTISNQGGIGGRHFTPIINKPEVAILGMGRGFSSPDGKTLMPIGLSYDHRVIDGGSAARFVVALAESLAGLTDKDTLLKG